ncbi:MAG: polysaccharide biosynthesis protein [Bacteroidia bacterium]|nr:polysaccharide biosynthesis protein [Bacteroidia bacterium]
MNELFEGKDILVTGGCGSIGSEIVKQLIPFDPKRVRVLDNSESGHFNLNQKIKSNRIRNLIGDVRDRDRILRAAEGVDYIFHAAALKHVPFCEYNPFEAVYTNVIGTKHVVEAAIENNVQKMVGISTDKAVSPINTMGATKLLGERIIINAPLGTSQTNFACVRFGNVLNSVGSVIPLFRNQISQGGPITLTSEDMTRFFMTIPQAVSLILRAAENMNGREIFVLKMNGLKIKDLAEVMIQELAAKYGHKPDDIEIKVIGLRPGEKLYEALFTEEERPFIEETDSMFILRNSPYDNFQPDTHASFSNYSSDNMEMLSQEEIRDLLYREQIL